MPEGVSVFCNCGEVAMIMNELFSVPEVVACAARLSSVSAISHSNDTDHHILSFLKKNVASLMACPSSAEAISAGAAMLSAGKRVLVVTKEPDIIAVKNTAQSRLPLLIFAASYPEDIMALRDTGAIIVFCFSNQELFDTIVQFFRICEDGKVLLPCIIVWDGPVSYSEPFVVVSDQMIKNFLPQLRLPQKLDVKRPSFLGIDETKDFRQQEFKIMESVSKNMSVFDDNWKRKFKRPLPAYEKYMCDDAEFVLVTYGYHSNTAKAAVDTLRAQGKKAGLLRIRVFRPFPAASASEISQKKVAVLDFAVSPGSGSPLYQEIKTAAKFCISFISFQKYLSEKDFLEIFSRLEKSEKEEVFWL